MKSNILPSPLTGFTAHLLCVAGCASLAAQTAETPLFSVHEVELRASGNYESPYLELMADVVLMPPEGTTILTGA